MHTLTQSLCRQVVVSSKAISHPCIILQLLLLNVRAVPNMRPLVSVLDDYRVSGKVGWVHPGVRGQALTLGVYLARYSLAHPNGCGDTVC